MVQPVGSAGSGKQFLSTAGKVVGTTAAVVSAATRFDMAREAVQRGDWDIAAHYGITGVLSGATARVKNPGFNIGVGVGSLAEGALWRGADQPIVDALSTLNDNYQQHRNAYETDYNKWAENCK